MPQTFATSDAVELAVVERSGFIESRHSGSALVLGPDGVVIEQLGDPAAPVLPRSSLKPLQALACLTAGAVLEGEPEAVESVLRLSREGPRGAQVERVDVADEEPEALRGFVTR